MSMDHEPRAETPLDRAERDPIGLQHDWLHANEADTGEETLERAIDAATGADSEAIGASARQDAQERERRIRTQFG